MSYIHVKGIFSDKLGHMHRDLKPDNILLKKQDNRLDVKISDFGLAKDTNPDLRTSSKTGTPLYAAP